MTINWYSHVIFHDSTRPNNINAHVGANDIGKSKMQRLERLGMKAYAIVLFVQTDVFIDRQGHSRAQPISI